MKLLLKEASNAEQLYRLIIDKALDAFVTIDREGFITEWNESAEQSFGWSKEEVLGKLLADVLIPERYRTAHLHGLRQYNMTGLGNVLYRRVEMQALHRNGHEIPVELSVTPIVTPQRTVFFASIRDLSQRRQLEEKLSHTVGITTSILNSMAGAVIVAARDERLIMVNPAGQRLLQLKPAELAPNQKLEDLSLFTADGVTPLEPDMQPMGRALRGEHVDGLIVLVRPAGATEGGTWVSANARPLLDGNGVPIGGVVVFHDITEMRRREEQTHFLANHDALTGLPNRVNFSNQLHQSIARAQRSGIPLALLLLDLDRFKHVNDTFGHHTGDLLLKEVALRILSSIRETDFVARLGGDEFVIIQSDASQPDAADTLARKLVRALSQPCQLEGHSVLGGASVGICLYPKDGRNPVELMKRADLALYRAKHAGRCTWEFYTSELVSHENWKRDREVALRAALGKHQFELYYQPAVDLEDWSIASVEALLRWNATEMETVLPQQFLDIVEQNGLIVEIGEWALREACSQVRHWQMQGQPTLRLAINCSARQFNDPDFVARIPAILEESGLAASSLELEIPEAMLAQHPEIKDTLSDLRAQGIRLTIDNFGTGATALIDFTGFEIDALKIDKAFVQHLPHRREDSAIASAIINLAHNLGIRVIAGGVETPEQLAYLKARDCNGAQGFIFSPPLPAGKFEEEMLDGCHASIKRAVLLTGLH